MAWSLGLKNLIIPGGIVPLAGMPFDHARNVACMRALEVGASHIFFLDSDVIPPRDAILRLINHNQPIISGLYTRRSPPAAIPVMIKNGAWVTQYKPGSIVEVDLVGAGCLLIKREVLETFPPQREGHHWFDWKVNYQGGKLYPPGECMSEDFTFCINARKMGYKILVDTSIMCRHVGLAQSTYNRFEPCDATPVT